MEFTRRKKGKKLQIPKKKKKEKKKKSSAIYYQERTKQKERNCTSKVWKGKCNRELGEEETQSNYGVQRKK